MLISRLTLSSLALIVTVMAAACTSPSEPAASENAPAQTAAVQSDNTEATAAPEVPPSETDETAEIARTGSFESAEHPTAGGVELVSNGGQSVLRFDETFSSDSGPDLVVVLHQSANLLEETSPPAYPLNEEDYVVIAPLTSTTGAQEYVVPAEIDLSAFQSVAVWCQAFNATFGAASLQ